MHCTLKWTSSTAVPSGSPNGQAPFPTRFPSSADALATIDATMTVTAILEAGRRSLDAGGRPHEIDFDRAGEPQVVKAAE